MTEQLTDVTTDGRAETDSNRTWLKRSGALDSESTDETALEAEHSLRYSWGIALFLAAGLAFFAASAVFIAFGGTPPSSTPTASVIGHMGWFVGAALLAIGTIELIVKQDSLKDGLAGHLAVGSLGLATLAGLLWVTWAAIDVMASQQDQYEMFLQTIIAPVGAGFSVMYGMLVGGGIGALAYSTRGTQLTHRYMSWSGIGIGIAQVLGTAGVLLSASKNILFAGTTLGIPLLYAWSIVFAIDLYRRSEKRSTVTKN